MEFVYDCEGKSVREINDAIKTAIREGATSVRVQNPAARHNLGVAILAGTPVTFEGSVGYYCGGLSDGARLKILGSAGWGMAESSLSGEFVVRGNAGNAAGAALRGGTLAILGDASSRAGVAMKGGTLLIEGDCGYMTGFMGQKGTIIVGGDAGEALGDSMYETQIFVGGKANDLGNDAIIETPSEADLTMLRQICAQYEVDFNKDWKKVLSGRQLWNFDKKAAVWREAL